MAANKRKILEAARKHAQKGAKGKALKEFGKLLKLDPRDSKVRLEIGDTYRRWGQVDEAVEAYSMVAEQFMLEGFDARAVAVFKQIQNLQPDTFSHYESLADLYQRMGLTAEAIGCLESAAEFYREAGQKQEALGLLRKMAAIDPSNTTSRIKVADLLQQEGMKEEAVSEYDAVLAELKLQGDTESAAKLFERILEIEPERVETLVLYTRNLIDRGSAQRAEPLAKRALELDKSPEHYELLADIYRMEKREEDLVALYRELADLYRERGDEDRTREILQRYVPLEELGSAEAPNGYIDEGEDLDELEVGDETSLLDGDLLSDPSLLVTDDDSGLGILNPDDSLSDFNSDSLSMLSDSSEMTRLLPDELSGGASSDASGDGKAEIDISQLLAEASVYLRYGKHSQAIANLESILERDADHRLALEKLGEVLAEGDDSAKAVEMWRRAAHLAAESGETDAAELLRTRIAGLDPAAAEALDLVVADLPAPDGDPGEQLIADGLIDEASDDFPIPDDLASVSPDNEPASLDGADLPELDLTEVSIHSMDIEIEIDNASFTEEAENEQLPTEPETKLAADDPASIADANKDEISTDDISNAGEAAESSEVDVDDGGIKGEAQAASGASGGDVSPEKIAEDLEEADFYMEQGLLDEAEALYSRVLSIAPNHPHTMLRLGELASRRGEAPGPVVSATDSPGAVADSVDSVSEEPAESGIGAGLASGQENLPAGEAQEASELPSGIDSETLTPGGSSDLVSVDEEDETGELPDVSAGLEKPEEPEPLEALESPVEISSKTLDGEDKPAEGGDDLGFDLAAELSRSFDQDPGASSGATGAAGRGDTSEDGFASVFAEFKKGVSETLAEGDHQAHYDLGIAYREMGLLSDAITELRLAMNDSERYVGCLHLMGICAHEMGEPEQAIAHFTEALSSGDISGMTFLALKLDLGKSHSAAGDIASARRAYEEIQAIDPDFSDVASCLNELGKSEEYETFEEFLEDPDEPDAAKPEAATGLTGGAEEAPVWETFDDVIAEVEAADKADSSSQKPETTAPAESVSELEEPKPAKPAKPASETETTPKRRKKKISFV